MTDLTLRTDSFIGAALPKLGDVPGAAIEMVQVA